ncbi:MAG: DUF5071 domain-containing protein [Roseburia sp.]|nr:DUF5071 domain-containing protein [Roseburia sp.]
MKYSFDDLSLRHCESKERFSAAVDYFAAADIPNEFFLAPVTAGSEVYGKDYWEGFAKVLVKRGIAKLGGDKRKMLYWLQDLNWPGSGEVAEFVRQNFNVLKQEIIECVAEAHYIRDIIWFKNLLSFFNGKNDYAKTVADYLEDDCWKDFDNKFNLADLFCELKK